MAFTRRKFIEASGLLAASRATRDAPMQDRVSAIQRRTSTIASDVRLSETTRLNLVQSLRNDVGLLKDHPNEIEIGNATGKHSIAREEIEGMKRSELSIKPSGLEHNLTDQQLADLVCYLKSL